MLFRDWEFISDIPENVKPCFYDKTYNYSNEWFVTLKRRYKGEKGEKGVVYINKLIDDTMDYYKDSIDVNSLRKIKETLQKSIKGLNNIIETYKKDDQERVSKDYMTCLEKINDMIIIFDKKINNKKSFFSHTPIIFVENKYLITD